MRETLRLGHLAGIRIGVNWSVLVIFTLILVGLAVGQFPATFPDRPPMAYVVAGAIAAVLFFLSLLAHEMAHAIVAQRNGIEVEGITLWLFGGVAKLLGEADDPDTDLRVAGVGPLVSLVLGALFGALALFFMGTGIEGLPLGVAGWLAVINVVLAVFNLVPASPLDGGRILRSFVWRRTGDRTRAAVTAARAGRTFGIILVALGLLEIIFIPGFGGLWWMLIGWFIMAAAGAEEQHAQLQHRLGGVRVADVMSRDPVTVPGRMSVADLIEDYVWRHRFSSFPVVDGAGRPDGLITLARVKEVPVDQRPTTPVERVAAPLDEVPQTSPERPLPELLTKLGASGESRILVLDGDQVVGIISPADVTRSLELAELRRSSDHSHL